MKKIKTIIRHLIFIYEIAPSLKSWYGLFILFIANVVVRTRSKKYLQSKKTYALIIAHNQIHNVTLRTSDYFILFEIFGLKIYNEFIQRVPKNGLIIDLGAHIGLASLFFSAHLKNQIRVFEPSPANLALLRKNLAGFTQITICDQAVSDTCGSTILHVYETIPSRNSLKEGSGDYKTTPIIVNTITLDHILEQESNIAGIKFDIEGMEYDVFKHSTHSKFVPYLLGEIKIDGKYNLENFLSLFPNHKAIVTEIGLNTYVVSLEIQTHNNPGNK